MSTMPEPIQDNRYIQTGRPEESANSKKIERKPEGPPNSQKDYKDVAESSNAPKKTKENTKPQRGEGQPSIFELSRKQARRSHDDATSDDSSSERGSDLMDALKGTVDVSKTSSSDSLTRNAFTTDQPDLAGLAAAAQAVPHLSPHEVPMSAQGAEASARVGATHRAEIVAMIQQIVDKAHTVSTKGQTDTTFDIRFPTGHAFEGMSVTISAYKDAPKEINISFTNLTAQAQDMIQNATNQAQLAQMLDTRGIHVHMILPTTQLETPIMVEGKQGANRDRGEQQSGSGGQPREERSR